MTNNARIKPKYIFMCGLALLLMVSQAFAAGEEDPAVLITVTEVMAENVSPSVPAAGSVFSRHAMQITAGIAGRLEWVAEPGDFIEAGQPVARFDCEMLNLQREEQVAQAQYERISFEALGREADRLEQLRESFVTSATQLERTQADRDLAGSQLRIARVRLKQIDSQLKRCIVSAPFSGVVTDRLQHAGEDVERSTVLATMTDTQNLEVRASVPIRYLPRMQVGDIADVRLNDIQLEGSIRKVVPAADPLSQTFEVRVELPAGAADFVAAGQLVSVGLPLSARAALTIPRDSIVLRENGAFVMRINTQDKAEPVSIEVAETKGERVAIRGALKQGDRIAVRGAEALDDGKSVAIQTET